MSRRLNFVHNFTIIQLILNYRHFFGVLLTKECLLPWQFDLPLAGVDGTASGMADTFALAMAAQSANDNFVVGVVCGVCQHQWSEGLHYQKTKVKRMGYMRSAMFFSLFAVATILAMTACGGGEPLRQTETPGGPAPTQLTPMPALTQLTPLPAVPSQTPLPSPTPTPPPLPAPEQTALQFEQSIVPLLDRRGQLPQAPNGLDLPPLEEMQVVLVPATQHLYYIQSVLYPESLPEVAAGEGVLYLIYSYSRGENLRSVFSPLPFAPTTQEVKVQLQRVVEIDGQVYIYEEANGVGGEGTQDERELVTQALDDLNLAVFLGAHSTAIRDQLESIIGSATGIILSEQISQTRQVALLERALESGNWSDRAKAATFLGNLGAIDSLPALIAALRFQGASDQSRLLETINKLKPGTIDPEQHENPAYLAGALASPEWETRATAAMLLGRPSWEREWELGPVLPGLQALLADPQAEVRAAAAWALDECGYVEAAPAVPALILALGDEQAKVRQNAAAALSLSQEDPGQVVPALIGALQDQDYQVRANAARVLGYFGPASAEAVPSLEQSLDDEFIQIRYLASGTLGEIGPQAVAALPRLLETIVADESAAVRIAALRAAPLIAPDATETIAALAHALSDPHSEVRKAAAWELTVLGDKAIAAVPALIAALQDPDEKVRENALQALKDLTGQDLPPEPDAWLKWWEGQ